MGTIWFELERIAQNRWPQPQLKIYLTFYSIFRGNKTFAFEKYEKRKGKRFQGTENRNLLLELHVIAMMIFATA